MQHGSTTGVSQDPSKAVEKPGYRWFSRALIGLMIAAFASIVGYWWNVHRPESCYDRGRAALALGDDDTVNLEADRLIQIPEFEPQGRLLRGLLLARRGKFSEALQDLQKAGSDSTNVETGAAAAECLYKLGRFAEAIDAAHSALVIDPHFVDARRWLAAAYYDLGALPNAVVELKQISADAPSDSRPDRLLGLIAKDGENFDSAVNHYRESLKRDPRQLDHESIQIELSECLIKLGKFDEAISVLQQCRRSVETLTLEAEAKRGVGQFEEAQSLLNEASTLNPRYFPARLELGKLLLDLQRVEPAIAVLDEAVKLEPMNRVAHLQLSQALRQSGDAGRADTELNRMQEIQVIEREFSDLHESASKYPESIEIRMRLADLARQLGKPELAKMWYRAARALDSANQQSRAAVDLENQPQR